MSIVLKENEWARQQLAERSLGKRPAETLRRVARYYLDEGLTKSQVYKRLDAFIMQCGTDITAMRKDVRIENAIKLAQKYPAVDIDYIIITIPELEVIDTLTGTQARRLAFTLLCLAKYYATISPESTGWVNESNSEIMKMSNVKTSLKRQSLLFRVIRDAGIIRFSKNVGNTNVQVLLSKEGDTAMKITDFRNLGYQYLKYHGGAYFECQSCGVTTRYNDVTNKRGQKYCSACAAKIATRQKVESVMRHKTYGDSHESAS